MSETLNERLRKQRDEGTERIAELEQELAKAHAEIERLRAMCAVFPETTPAVVAEEERQEQLAKAQQNVEILRAENIRLIEHIGFWERSSVAALCRLYNLPSPAAGE